MESIFSKELNSLTKQRDHLNMQITSCIKFYSYLLDGVNPKLIIPDRNDFVEATENKEVRKVVVYEIYLRGVYYRSYNNESNECTQCGKETDGKYFSYLSTDVCICSATCYYVHLKALTFPDRVVSFIEDNEYNDTVEDIYYDNKLLETL